MRITTIKLSKQILDDLDFQDVFTFVDRTTSRIGQQYLYNKLLNPANNKYLKYTYRSVKVSFKHVSLKTDPYPISVKYLQEDLKMAVSAEGLGNPAIIVIEGVVGLATDD